MATLEDYLDMAARVYDRNCSTGVVEGDFEVVAFEMATGLGDGFQGAIFEGSNESVVAFAGTTGNLRTAPLTQNTANARIGLGIIPNMAGAAYALANQAIARRGNVSLVGHSLGGALAQVVSVWTGMPFISFNGPGMALHLQISRFNVTHPHQLLRTVNADSPRDAVGICFVNGDDFVGNFGRHVGQLVRLPTGPDNHGLNAIRAGLGEMISQQPRYWVPSFSQVAPELPVPDFGQRVSRLFHNTGINGFLCKPERRIGAVEAP